jgi:hypothetical protein
MVRNHIQKNTGRRGRSVVRRTSGDSSGTRRQPLSLASANVDTRYATPIRSVFPVPTRSPGRRSPIAPRAPRKTSRPVRRATPGRGVRYSSLQRVRPRMLRFLDESARSGPSSSPIPPNTPAVTSRRPRRQTPRTAQGTTRTAQGTTRTVQGTTRTTQGTPRRK